MAITRKKRNTPHYKEMYRLTKLENNNLRRDLKILMDERVKGFDFSGILFLLHLIIKIVEYENRGGETMRK